MKVTRFAGHVAGAVIFHTHVNCGVSVVYCDQTEKHVSPNYSPKNQQFSFWGREETVWTRASCVPQMKRRKAKMVNRLWLEDGEQVARGRLTPKRYLGTFQKYWRRRRPSGPTMGGYCKGRLCLFEEEANGRRTRQERG